jgi:hypothetical protein
MLVLLAWPAVAQPNGNYRGECRQLTKQIARYVRDANMARDRDNALWERANLEQIDRLAARRAYLCPQYARQEDSKLLRDIGRLLGVAAALGLKYLTFGLM